MGQLLVYAGMLDGREVAWIPAYGPEMRGGTANCSVTISSREISSPVVFQPNVAIIMNRPSLEKFEPMVKPGGSLLVNTSLVREPGQRQDLRSFGVPCNDIADELGNGRVANMVMLGAFLELTGAVSPESVINSLRKVLGPKKENLIGINRKALDAGAAWLQQAAAVESQVS